MQSRQAGGRDEPCHWPVHPYRCQRRDRSQRKVAPAATSGWLGELGDLPEYVGAWITTKPASAMPRTFRCSFPVIPQRSSTHAGWSRRDTSRERLLLIRRFGSSMRRMFCCSCSTSRPWLRGARLRSFPFAGRVQRGRTDRATGGNAYAGTPPLAASTWTFCHYT